MSKPITLNEKIKMFSILLIEDEEKLRNSLQRYLQKLFTHVTTACNGQEGLNLYQEYRYDIVITDIQMPYLNGLEMAKEIKKINSEQEIIILSGYNDITYFLDAINLGINAYITKPIEYFKMNNILSKSIDNINNIKENFKYKMNLEKNLNKSTNENIALEKEKVDNFEKTLISFVSMIESRDTYTAGHSQRVASYCRIIAKEMSLSEEECNLIYRAGILHDIGKINTPDSILLKPGRLTKLEFNIIREHVSESYNILLGIPMYSDMADIIICHHERYDGNGYPNKLKGEEISILAHIMIVADAFDAMTTSRIYKDSKDTFNAIK